LNLSSKHHFWYHCLVTRRQLKIIHIGFENKLTNELNTIFLPKILKR
jgi:hypothetical protein